MTYRNAEGYPDPTAGEALANVCREQCAALWAQAIRAKHNDRPKSSRPPRSVQRARQKANKHFRSRMRARTHAYVREPLHRTVTTRNSYGRRLWQNEIL